MMKRVKAMPPSLSELKVLPSFCFAFKIPDDRAVTNIYMRVLYRESQKEYRHKQSRIVSYSPLALLHMTNLYGAPYHGL